MKAVNLGDDADTVGAITGQVVGAYYGLDILTEWVNKLAKKYCKKWIIQFFLMIRRDRR